MILSNTSLHAALDSGQIRIEPEPSPRTHVPGQKCPFQTSAVDLSLGDEVSFFKTGKSLPVGIDLRTGNFADLFLPYADRLTITSRQPYALAPNQLVLAKTREKVTLELSEKGPWLAARVEGKSSYARCGLLVHFTAPTIHAGFSGTITLELINLGPLSILLYPDMPICQLIVEQVDGKPFRNDSQFQNQASAGGGLKG